MLNSGNIPADFWISHQRRFPRIQTEFHALHAFEDGSFREEPVTNLSKGGLFLRSKRPRKKGERIEIILMLPDQSAEVTVQGQVMYCNYLGDQLEYTYGMGIMFTAIEPNLKKWLGHFIDRLIQDEGGGKRVEPRVHTDPCKITLNKSGKESGAMLCNISRHGMYIRTDHSYSLFERVETVLEHPNSALKMEVAGEIIHIQKMDNNSLPYGMGLRFVDLTTSMEEAILSLLRDILFTKN